jgi:DNA-3-methyladenine glycosylase
MCIKSYGIHWCLNLVSGPEPGAAVLIRALEPTDGIETMTARRGTKELRKLCARPGRLCEALGVTRDKHNGRALDRPPFQLWARASAPSIVTGVRIGLTKGVKTAWRFGLADSRFLSRPF